MRQWPTVCVLIVASGCASLGEVGRTPTFTPVEGGLEHRAMVTSAPALDLRELAAEREPSLWASGRDSLFGDRRAGQLGDILTVVIEIDDSAEISNNTTMSRSGSESMGMPSLLGLEGLATGILPGSPDPGSLIETQSQSRANGQGSVRRNEALALRIAATVVDVLGNGVLRIQGTQEVRVNNEIRELLVSGYVRPEDISRQNEITYDKIASARISYGGRGHISNAQSPRLGQQALGAVLPF